MKEKKDYITNPTLFGKPEIVGFGSDDFYVKEIAKRLSKETIINNHYSKKVYNGTYIHLGIYLNNEFVGVLQYGYAMNPASGGSVVKDTELTNYLELNRMWLDDKAPRNSESMALSYSIKYIKGKYPSKDGYVSDGYWAEKLQIASDINPFVFSPDDTLKELQNGIDGELEKYGYEGEELEKMKEYYEECIEFCENYSNGESYLHEAHNNLPNFCDHEAVVYCSEIKNQLKIIFDAFEEICSRC